jgi:hypothetical protein
MRILAVVLVASIVSIFGAAELSSAGNEGHGPLGDTAIIAGSVDCFPNPGGAILSLNTNMGGAIVGVPSSPQFGFSISGQRTGTCAEAIASLAGQLPSPLCSEGPPPFGGEGFALVCSGRARSVVAAIGEFAKKVISP